MTAAAESTGLARVRSRASFAYVHLFFRRQAPVGLFLVAICVLFELVASRTGSAQPSTFVALALTGIGLAHNAARDRTRPNAEYLRSLPLHRGADVLASVWVGACWALLIGSLILVLRWTGGSYWVLRAYAALTGSHPGSGTWQAVPWPPLETLGIVWFCYWAMSLALIMDAESLRTIGRGGARPRSKQSAQNLRLLMVGSQVLAFVLPLWLAIKHMSGPYPNPSFVGPALGALYLGLGTLQMRRVAAVARRVELDVLPSGLPNGRDASWQGAGR